MPVLIIILLIYCKIKKIDIYATFTDGAKKSLPLVGSLFCYLAAVFFMTELFRASGLNAFLERVLAPVFSKVGINKELTPLIILKPFSANASLATLTDIYLSFGADSYIARVASCIYFSSETTFYISAVYFAKCKNKKIVLPIIISIISFLATCVLACVLCRFI